MIEDALVVPAEWTPGFQSGERGFESRRGCSIARWWNGRHAALRRPCPSGVRVQVPLWLLRLRLSALSRKRRLLAKWRNWQTHPAQTRTSQDVRVRLPPWPLFEERLRGRLTGRTTGSEPANVGSIPAPGTLLCALCVSVVNNFEPQRHREHRRQLSLECGGGTPLCEGGSCRFDSCRGYCGRTQSGSGTRL